MVPQLVRHPLLLRAIPRARDLVRLGVVLALFLPLLACLPDRLAWSPDGKTLHWVDPGGGGVLRSYDVATRTLSPVAQDAPRSVVFCFTAGARVFFATERPKAKPEDRAIRDLHLLDADGSGSVEIAKDVNVECGMAASADGSLAFFIRDENAAGGKYELWRADLSKDAPSDGRGAPPVARVLAAPRAFGYPSSNADGSKLVVTFDDHLATIDVAKGEIAKLLEATKKLPHLYGQWALDGKSVVFLRTHEKKNDPESASDLSELCALDLATGGVRALAKGVSILRRPILGAGGRVAYVTQAAIDTEGEMGDVPMSKIQVARIDLETGARRFVTSEANGALWPMPDPTGAKVAYFTARQNSRGEDPDHLRLRLIDAEVPAGTHYSAPISIP